MGSEGLGWGFSVHLRPTTLAHSSVQPHPNLPSPWHRVSYKNTPPVPSKPSPYFSHDYFSHCWAELSHPSTSPVPNGKHLCAVDWKTTSLEDKAWGLPFRYPHLFPKLTLFLTLLRDADVSSLKQGGHWPLWTPTLIISQRPFLNQHKEGGQLCVRPLL